MASKPEIETIRGEEVREVAKKYEDGTVMKGSGEAIYIIEAGKKRVIPNFFTYVKLGISEGEIVHLADKEIEAIPGGEPIPEIKPKGTPPHAKAKLAELVKRLG